MREDAVAKEPEHEVAIVGAGVTGLAAAAVLGRCQRRVVVIGLPERDNSTATGVHNFPYDEGVSPDTLYARMEEALTKYPIPVIRECVVDARIGESQSVVLRTSAGRSVHAARLLLANGVAHQLPGWVPEGTWGKSVFGCPFCHAFEHAGQHFVIVGPPVSMTLEIALLCMPHAKRLTVLVPAAGPDETPLADLIRQAGGDVFVDSVATVSADGSGALTIHTAAGRELVAGAMIPFGITRMRTELATSLGLRTNQVGIPEADAEGRSSHPAVWVAGTAAQPQLVLVEAMGSGIRAAMSIHKDLVLRSAE